MPEHGSSAQGNDAARNDAIHGDAVRNSLSVAMVACNEEANIARTLASVIDLAVEIVLIDSGSTDHTLEIARSFGAKVKIFNEPWKGFARQKKFRHRQDHRRLGAAAGRR